jgi:hypothetical protein
MSEQIQNYFKENKYVVIRNFISQDTSLLLYNYCKLKVQRQDYRYTYDRNSYDKDWDGEWGDGQVSNAYSLYGDPIMDSLLQLSTNSMQVYTGLELLPQYSYWRLYQKGNVLDRHIDRDACEISTTLCLGYDVSDVDENVYPEYDWPMFVQSPSKEELPIHMKPGDLIIYRGCEIEHWRDKFIGKNHAQVFMHYNDATGPYKQIFDTRPNLGLPKKTNNWRV